MSETVKRTVLDYDDICQMAPFFQGKPKLVKFLMHLLSVDKVNWIHDHNFDTPGVPFVQGLLSDLDIKMDVEGREVLENLPEGGFITISNHPFGALDGIMLIKLVGEYRPDFKVMVNMILNHITAMRPNFIAVDAYESDDPAHRAVSVHGIAESIGHVRGGHPLGFFPAGAVSKFSRNMRVEDRAWQPSVMRIIQKMRVPVIPICFHGRNSLWSLFLGMVDWRLRTLRLPAEVFRRKGDTFRISVGQPIMPDVISQYNTEQLASFLKQQTYALKGWKL
ncbi:MAG: lysophospholipid acyltransferase family protein [Muribaculaceae bacterium]|nr:lysophospholipid acyltransferase family protein [Muribaculaceae bacterium]